MIHESTVSSDEVTINAPIELVWEILLDFENYGEWNTFCPSAKVDSLEMGSPITMQVDLGDGLAEQVEFICRVDPLQCIAWRMNNEPGDPITAVRSQHLKSVDTNTCTYISVDEFGGEQAQAMMEAFAPQVEAGFNRCAYDLKAHAEARYSAAP